MSRIRDTAASAAAVLGAARVALGAPPSVRIIREDIGVPAARTSWLTIIALCAIAVILLAINGYTGYAITAGAVGAAASVNLL